MRTRDQRPHVHICHWVTNAPRLDGRRQVIHEIVQHALVYQQPRAGAAILTAVFKHATRHGSRGNRDIGIIKNHAGAFTTQLEGDALDGLRCSSSDVLTDSSATRESNLRHVWVIHERPPSSDTRACHDVQHA